MKLAKADLPPSLARYLGDFEAEIDLGRLVGVDDHRNECFECGEHAVTRPLAVAPDGDLPQKGQFCRDCQTNLVERNIAQAAEQTRKARLGELAEQDDPTEPDLEGTDLEDAVEDAG